MFGRDDLETQLRIALAECARLREENLRLRRQSPSPTDKPSPGPLKSARSELAAPPAQYVTKASSSAEKVNLFWSLFHGRDDVYPLRWEDRKGRSGYSPACANEWDRNLCLKPKGKCADCQNRNLLPVTEEVLRDHLQGKHTIGVYPLLTDDRCWFLAADFDKKYWQDDILTFLKTCNEMSIPAAVERSRSGNGAHLWIFFQEPIEASLARKLGSLVLTRALEKRHQIGLDSYDRFFPNQDTLPKGGFGNLIALPLQKAPRQDGNSVFVDENFIPFEDQWQFLSSLEGMPRERVKAIVDHAARQNQIIPIRPGLIAEDAEENPWALNSPGISKKVADAALPEKITLTLANLIFIEKEGLPPVVINHLLKMAAFQNPEFYKAQAMRLSTFGKPRIIHCAEDFPHRLGLPRGCLEDLQGFFADQGAGIVRVDERFRGNSIDVAFHGALRPEQEEASRAMLAHDIGVLSAPPAFGKTIVAARIIADRQVNSLIVVHRRQLLEQWQDRLAVHLNISPQRIGIVGGGRKNRTGFIDIALMQSLNRKGIVTELVEEYGQVIVDECHHLPAFSFERILKKVRAKFVFGLTATPIRRDGHHPIITMQCGPIRCKISHQKKSGETSVSHQIFPRFTDFALPKEVSASKIHGIYAALAADENRNSLIFNDLLAALEAGRSPLLLTERKDHLEYFARRVERFAKNVIVLKGGMGKTQRQEVMKKMKAVPDTQERLILATGRYIGEGFDDARLDTLFLTLPISWRGTLQQYVGRLHRAHDNKRVVQVYDYVDEKVPLLERMYQKRLKGYKAIGYEIKKKDAC